MLSPELFGASVNIWRIRTTHRCSFQCFHLWWTIF